MLRDRRLLPGRLYEQGNGFLARAHSIPASITVLGAAAVLPGGIQLASGRNEAGPSRAPVVERCFFPLYLDSFLLTPHN